jgi:glucose/mannose-6-phosphate isomerase
MESNLKYDVGSVHATLDNFHHQIEHAIEIGKGMAPIRLDSKPEEIIITGMGGSAIGGDLFKMFILHSKLSQKLKISINRQYELPEYVDERCLVIASSYSGNTEETISSLEHASRKTNKLACITTGGKIEKYCKDNNIQIYKMPEGFYPRCAVGYSFILLNYLLINSSILSESANVSLIIQLDELKEFVKKLQKKYNVHDFNNPAFKLANELFEKIPVIYSSDLMSAVNLRWRGQFQENSKSIAFGNLVPEMNHNEINGWFKPDCALNKFKIILLRDRENNSRVKIRMDAMRELFKETGIDCSEFYGIGDTFINRMFDLLLMADWASYYLAVLYKLDPNAIPIILKFKEILAKAKDKDKDKND